MTDEYVYNLIKDLLPPENVVPRAVQWTAMQSKVQDDLMQAVRNLCKQGKIGFNKTLNGIMFNLK